jgi:hypothetical protein
MLHTRLAALALASITLAVAGCGESKTSSAPKTTPLPLKTTSQGPKTLATPTGPLTRAEMLAETNEICARLLTRLDSSTLRTTQDYFRILPQLASYERLIAAQLSKLNPPVSLVHGWRQAILSIETLSDNTLKGVQYVKSGRTKAGQALLAANAKTRKPMLDAARRAGFAQCANIF